MESKPYTKLTYKEVSIYEHVFSSIWRWYSILLCLPGLLETDNCCGHINWCFFRPCFLLRCFLLAPSIHHRRPTLCLKERYFFPFSERNKIVLDFISLFRKNLIISKVKCNICQCLPGKNGRCKIDNSFDFTRYS